MECRVISETSTPLVCTAPSGTNRRSPSACPTRHTGPTSKRGFPIFRTRPDAHTPRMHAQGSGKLAGAWGSEIMRGFTQWRSPSARSQVSSGRGVVTISWPCKRLARHSGARSARLTCRRCSAHRPACCGRPEAGLGVSGRAVGRAVGREVGRAVGRAVHAGDSSGTEWLQRVLQSGFGCGPRDESVARPSPWELACPSLPSVWSHP